MKENFADKSTWRFNYIGVRKMKWDQLWHALYKTKDGREDWNRISRVDALVLAEHLWD